MHENAPLNLLFHVGYGVLLLQDLKSTFEKFASVNNLPRFIIGVGLPDGIDDIDKGYDLPEINK